MADRLISIALLGPNFYVSGPFGNNLGGGTAEFRDEFQHKFNSNVHHTFVALGEDGDSFRKWWDSATEKHTWSWDLGGQYDGLVVALRAPGTPVFVSLGTDGYYFMRRENGTYVWRLPDTAHDFVQDVDNVDPVREVWFGIDGTYVLQTRSGQLTWRLKGHYGSLDNTLTYSHKIKALGMNLENDRSYWVISSDGKIVGNPGGTSLTKADFESWVARFY